MFFKTFIATLLASSAAATPLFSARSAGNAFGLIAINSGTNLQNRAINAFDSGLWIGKEPSSYCPLATGCPAGDYTTFVAGEDTLALNVAVPGGQQVYVADSYAVSFTSPHSADTHSGKTTGWKYTAGEGSNLGSLSFTDYGFIACASTNSSTYQVFLTPGRTGTGNCTSIAVATVPSSDAGASAWEYA